MGTFNLNMYHKTLIEDKFMIAEEGYMKAVCRLREGCIEVFLDHFRPI